MTEPQWQRGLILALSGPPGVGKTTIAKQLHVLEPRLIKPVGLTTRQPRIGETQGRDALFVNDWHFDWTKKRGALLEHTEIFGHRYGTRKVAVERLLENRCDALLILDLNGIQQIQKQMPEDLVSVYIGAPSITELIRRLKARGETELETHRRVMLAADQLKTARFYTHKVLNHDLDKTVEAIRAILKTARARRTHS